MAGKRILSPFVQELIRWRWETRPTIKSLAEEYKVSRSCISDIINPELRNRRKKKYRDSKKVESEGPDPQERTLQNPYPAKRVSRRVA